MRTTLLLLALTTAAVHAGDPSITLLSGVRFGTVHQDCWIKNTTTGTVITPDSDCLKQFPPSYIAECDEVDHTLFDLSCIVHSKVFGFATQSLIAVEYSAEASVQSTTNYISHADSAGTAEAISWIGIGNDGDFNNYLVPLYLLLHLDINGTGYTYGTTAECYANGNNHLEATFVKQGGVDKWHIVGKRQLTANTFDTINEYVAADHGKYERSGQAYYVAGSDFISTAEVNALQANGGSVTATGQAGPLTFDSKVRAEVKFVWNQITGY